MMEKKKSYLVFLDKFNVKRKKVGRQLLGFFITKGNISTFLKINN